MTYSRLFFNGNLSENLSSNLDKSQSHYIAKVMRIKEGENFLLFNNGGEWQARIQEIKKNIVKFKIVKKLKNSENDHEIWLAFTPTAPQVFAPTSPAHVSQAEFSAPQMVSFKPFRCRWTTCYRSVICFVGSNKSTYSVGSDINCQR